MQIKPSTSSEWRTPKWLFDKYNANFKFDLDACASPDNNLVKNYYTIENKIQEQRTIDIVNTYNSIYCNPPYDKKSLEKITIFFTGLIVFAMNHKKVINICMLVPCKTDQNWWTWACDMATEISFIRGRLKFSNARHSSQQSHAIFIFNSLFYGHQKITTTYHNAV